MKIRWTRKAARELNAACDYVAGDEAAADRILLTIHEAVGQLEFHPLMGREGRVETTREMVITGTPYIVAYRIRKDSSVQVLSVLHGRRRWPDRF